VGSKEAEYSALSSTLKPVGAKLLKMKNLKQNKTGSLSEQIKVGGMKRKLIP